MSLKLTDALFNLEYIAMQVGTEIANNGANVFTSEEVLCEVNGQIELSKVAVPLYNGADVTVAFVNVSGDSDKEKMIVNGKVISDSRLLAGTKYCVLYKYNSNSARSLVIPSQFVPKTLHATLTVSLYVGESCDADSSTKCGELVIDIPRFQLNGAMDLTLSATGAAQSSLEGFALSSGCDSCDGNGFYATVSEVIFDAHWYDNAEGLIIEDLSSMKKDDVRDLVVYAYYKNSAPKKIALDELTVAADNVVLTYAEGKVTAASVGDGHITVAAKEKAELETAKYVKVTAAG